MIHIWRPWKLSSFQDLCPSPLSIYIQNSFILLTLDVQFQTTSPPTSSPNDKMITNQLKENTVQEWLLYIITCFLQVGFRFQYQLINLVWLSCDFFSFSWSFTICFSMALYFCVYSCPKIIHILQSTCFICTTRKRKQTMDQQLHRACNRTKSKLNTRPNPITFNFTTRSI